MAVQEVAEFAINRLNCGSNGYDQESCELEGEKDQFERQCIKFVESVVWKYSNFRSVLRMEMGLFIPVLKLQYFYFKPNLYKTFK